MATMRTGDDRARVPVRYLGGVQRSGSTLLARMLGRVHGEVSVGEVVHLWTRGLRDGEVCGCGEPLPSCPFWTEVGTRAFGGWDRFDLGEARRLQRAVDRNRYIPMMLIPRIWPRYRRDLLAYAGVLGALYRGIHEASGGCVVVDASKHASTAFLLRRVGPVHLRVTHLVRDGRGVAFSLAKRVRRPEADAVAAGPTSSEGDLMFRSRPWRSALAWDVYNLLFHVLGLIGTRTRTLRYEDLVAQPEQEVERIAADDGLAGADLTFIEAGAVALGVDHTVAGNPIRLQGGRVNLRADEAWRREMSPAARRTVEVLSGPLLLAYGYLGRGRGSHGASPGDSGGSS